MAFKKSRLAIFWVILTISTPGSRTQPHPLCRTLSNREELPPTHFPSAYACHGNDDDAVCTPRSAGTSGASPRKVIPGTVTWWVYEGRRQLLSSPAEDTGVGEWVDCTSYYARRSPVLDLSTVAGISPESILETASETFTASDELWREINPSKGKEATPSLPASQEFRTLQADAARGSTEVKITARSAGTAEIPRTNSANIRHGLVYAPNATCDDFWLAWPAMQERAIARGTVVVFDLNDSVGNLFRSLALLIQFVRLLDLGLILRGARFPGFGEAFDPGEIKWNIDAGPFLQQMGDIKGGADATGLHQLHFRNYAMVLSNSQLELLALTLDAKVASTEDLAAHFTRVLPNTMNKLMREVMVDSLEMNTRLRRQPCAWNMLLRRSPSMIASLEDYSPWGVGSSSSALRHQATEYVALHIRTSDGETARSYTTQQYVIQEPSSTVCPTFLVAMDDALQRTDTCLASHSVHADDSMVYISSNSKSMAKNCTLEAARDDIVVGHVDMGLDSSDAHTAFSKRPLQTALGAFLDFLFLMDSTIIVRTSSSFSGTVADMKGLHCHMQVYDSLPNRKLFLCLPPEC